MHEYSLSTKEGLALMSLAEALLRVPDAETQNRLIEDKLGAGDWEHAEARESESWLVSATTWALGLTVRLVYPHETPEGDHRAAGASGSARRPCAPPRARRCGSSGTSSCSARPSRTRCRAGATMRRKTYRHSFDMLGEGARTAPRRGALFRSLCARDRGDRQERRRRAARRGPASPSSSRRCIRATRRASASGC